VYSSQADSDNGVFFMSIGEIGWGWIDLAHDRDQQSASVKMVINLLVP
jgi:hypothetical protein